MTLENASITAEDIASHGLTEDEYQLALDILGGREPNMVELGIFSVFLTDPWGVTIELTEGLRTF